MILLIIRRERWPGPAGSGGPGWRGAAGRVGGERRAGPARGVRARGGRGGYGRAVGAADPGGVPRRTVIAAAAGLAAAACAPATQAGPTPTDPTPPGPTPAGAAPTVPRPYTPPPRTPRPLVRTADVPVGGGRVLPEHRVVVTQPTPGEFRGFGIVCTHDGCELDAVADGTINCPCHGSRYAVSDGSVVRGPARTGLRTEDVAVDGDTVVLL